MFNDELKNIADIVGGFLGDPKGEVNFSGWTEYNCPQCADLDGVRKDDKYNLCINYSRGAYHCWKCLDRGTLTTLIGKYGGPLALNEYYKSVAAIRSTRLYTYTKSNNDTLDRQNHNVEITLPQNYKRLDRNDKYAQKAYDYLNGRGIDDALIEQYSIGYVGYISDHNSPEYRLRNRIIIPSYGEFKKLNYWIARDYSGKTKLKYINPDVEKTFIVFNEDLVNWYEDVTLVEGVFDHMVIPNSIPLLGKTLTEENAVYNAIIKNAKANVNILLDDDAITDAFKIYKLLARSSFRDRIRIIVCPDGYDASLVYEKFGRKGVVALMRKAIKLTDFQLYGPKLPAVG